MHIEKECREITNKDVDRFLIKVSEKHTDILSCKDQDNVMEATVESTAEELGDMDFHMSVHYNQCLPEHVKERLSEYDLNRVE